MSRGAQEKAEDIRQLRKEYVPRGIANATPIVIDSAQGVEVTDVDGNKYIDFAGGIGVLNVGHCPETVVDAIKCQADKFLHSCFHVAIYDSYVRLAQRLSLLTPGSHSKKTMLVNSGAEAVENAVKIARAFTKRSEIIAVEGAFHGRTMLGMSLTSKTKPYKDGFGPFCSGVHRIPYAYCYRCPYGKTYPDCDVACAEALEIALQSHISANDVAAVIIEPQLGEGGFVPPPPEYLRRVWTICDRFGIVLIADEIQSGYGRTGKMLAVEHSGVVPDIVVLAKSMAAGLPLGAIVGREEIMDAPQVGGLGTTFGGNPLACVAALATLDIVTTPDFLERAATIGKKVHRCFSDLKEKYDIIGDVRGLGAMVGMELVRDRNDKLPAKEETDTILRKCHESGLLIISCGRYGNVIRALPPLTITDEELTRAFGILQAAFDECLSTARS